MAASWRMTDSVNNSNYWFEDGNIVLSIRGTRFRVHRGVLARHSKVFSDMTSIPQPPTADSCPTVPLDDDPQDWEKLLKIIYDCDLSHLSWETFKLPALAAVLRLGRKYAIDKLHESALERILGAIPDSLVKLDEHCSHSEDGVPIGDDFIDLLNLLLELDLDSRRPVVYWLCLYWLSLNEILHGVERLDGTIARLSLESIEKLLQGQNRILHSEEFMAFQDVCVPSPLCTEKVTCGSAVAIRSLAWPFPFVDAALKKGMHPVLKKLCQQCQDNLAGIRETHRLALWNNLPYYFGLGPQATE